MPKLSIIVPVYNSAKYLRPCLDSIINQTYKDFEVLLVDDGSNDNSLDICNEYCEKDSRVRVLRQSNSGAGKARDNGIYHCTGDYVGFVDSDDWIDCRMYEVMMNIADKQNIDVVRCNTTMHHGDKVELRWSPPFSEKVLDKSQIEQEFIPALIAPKEEGRYNERLLRGVVSFLIKKSIIVDNNIHFPDFVSGEDVVFVVKTILHADNMYIVPEGFYHYMFYNSESLSKTQSDKRLAHREMVRNELVDLIKPTSGYEECLRRWQQEDRRIVYLDLRIIVNDNSLSKKQKIDAIRGLIHNERTIHAFSHYDQHLPFQMQVLYFLIKNKCTHSLYYLVRQKSASDLTAHKTRVVFSFDDAREDSYRAIKIASQYGIKSTLNVTTAYVQGVIDEKTRPSLVPAMSVEQVRELYDNEFVEIACHSHNHINDFNDIIKGRTVLQEMIGSGKPLGFASPSSRINLEINPLEKFKGSGFVYVRIAPVLDRYKKLYRVVRKISRLFKLKILYALTYKTTLRLTTQNGYLIHGVPVLYDNTLQQLEQVVKVAINNHYDCVLIFHSILSDEEFMGKDNWSWDIGKYKMLCEWLKKMCDNDKITFAFTKDLI